MPADPQRTREIEEAVRSVRDQQLATLLTLIIGIAVEKHPEELRKALARVFDLKAIEEQGKRCLAQLNGIQGKVRELQSEVNRLEAQRSQR